MSAAAMQASAQQPPITSSSFIPASTSRQYQSQSPQNRYVYEANQELAAAQQNRQQRRQNAHENPTSYASQQPHHAPQTSSPANALPVDLPIHNRSRSLVQDQYDGAPVPPPRTSSQQLSPSPALIPPSTEPLEARVASSRYARQTAADAEAYARQKQNYSGDYNEPVREKARDDTATAAAGTARNRRIDPSSPDGFHHATGSRERGQQAATTPQSRSEPTMFSNAAPAPLMRENSEVINRLIVSDPQVDAERLQERVAEARPAPMGSDITPVTGLGVVGNEGVDDGGRGTARRQDYSKSSSRRKDVQFGDYMLGQTLGEGEFGKVKLGWKKDGSSQVAIKLIRRETVATNPSRLPKIYREISILRDLAHPNIVRLHEMVETERHIGIILEYASGGELFDYILNHRYLKDPAARRLFAQLVSGVGYLHKKGIVHRDLKLENLLLDQNRNIIITDFGFANTFDPADELSDEIEFSLNNKDFVRKYRLDRQDERGMRKGDLMQTSCGSPCYAAPELVVSDSLYTGRKVDVWSCGVILYAMLAGYLPFDDDPANPEGDNINLLYKYITTTPLTFPEYVTPHARDLLRRILVPDPRKRADLFEVARHSWLSEYHHVVSHITSSTTNVADIANTTIPSEGAPDTTPALNRSVSVREPSKASDRPPAAGLAGQNDRKGNTEEHADAMNSRQKSARHTIQPEYTAPQTHTARGAAPTLAPAAPINATLSKPLPQDPPVDTATRSASGQRLPPPVRPARDVPRSVSDSTGALAYAPATYQQVAQQVTRPSTGGSLTSATGPNGTRSDVRLPSRGSYGQPVAPTVATTNAQGRVTQPKATRGYNISGPIPHHQAHASLGQPITQQISAQPQQSSSMPPAAGAKGHHRRSSTLSGLGERLFGRSSSVMRKRDKDSDDARQKNGKKYPPTTMKEPFPSDGQPRPSIDSKRSFSFGLGKKRSSDLESHADPEKPSRRFSLIPNSMSLKGLMGSSKEQIGDSGSPQTGDFPQPPTNKAYSRPPTGQTPNLEYGTAQGNPTGNDGQQDRTRASKYNNFSRLPPVPYQQPSSQQPNDVYGGTGVYGQPQQPPNRTAYAHQGQYRQANQQHRPMYPEGFNSGDGSRPSMQQGRQGKAALTKNNRKFTDAYNNEYGPTHHGGSSGAVKKVQDFFRRRGRARHDDD